MTTASVQTVPDAIAVARDELLDARRIASDWQAKKHAAAAELSEVEAGLGERLLAAPDSERALTEEVVSLEARFRAASSALGVQNQRVAAAESRYLIAEADSLVAKADAVDAADEYERAKHNTKVRRLLDELEKVEGCKYVPEARLIQASVRAQIELEGVIGGPQTSWVVPVSERPIKRSTAPRGQAAVLRGMAAGEPIDELLRAEQLRLVDLPASVYGPDALVPAATYVSRADQLREDIGELEDEEQQLLEDVKRLTEYENAVRRNAGYASLARGTKQAADDPGPTYGPLSTRLQRLDNVQRRLEDTRAALAALA